MEVFPIWIPPTCTNRHKPIPIDFGTVSGRSDHDPNLSDREIASHVELRLPVRSHFGPSIRSEGLIAD